MSGRELICPTCGQTTSTGASPGKTVACKRCGGELRVPLREVSVGRELECPACGRTFETAAQPGKHTGCKHCGADVRVALRDAADTRPARVGARGPLEPAYERVAEAERRRQLATDRIAGLVMLALGPPAFVGLWVVGAPFSKLYVIAGFCSVMGVLILFRPRTGPPGR